ncbi:MAG TPA: VOC family protein [Nitrolancea sp.]|nr:VOC family protein [Nitrolancea sp.]
MREGIDHIVILVRDLQNATRIYQDLGFQVTYGGEHPGISHNALIPLQDGTYLELFAFLRPEGISGHRWSPLLESGGGLIDFALQVNDIDDTVDRIRARGLPYEWIDGSRRRPDGEMLAWRTAELVHGVVGEMPFLIEDVTPRSKRVPAGDVARHPLGVTGVQGIVIAVEDLGEVAEAYAKLLGALPPRIEIDEALGAETMSYSVGAQRLILARASGPESPIAAHIQRRGNCPYQVILAADSSGVATRIEAEPVAGARIVIEPGG